MGSPNERAYNLEFNIANPQLNTPDVLRFLVRDTNVNQNELNVPVNLVTGQWYHIAAVRTHNTSTLYLNGQVIGAQTAGNNINTGTGGIAALGRLANLNAFDARFLAGRLDEVVFYNRALTPREIGQLASV